MLRLVHLEEIEGLLLKAPVLVDLLEKKDVGIVKEVNCWLKSLERALNNNRMTIASNVASFRSVLVSADQGVIAAGISFHGKLTKRKIREASCSYVLQNANDIVANAIQRDINRFDEAESLMRQLIAVAKVKGAIQAKPEGLDHTQYLKTTWANLSSDSEMLAGTVRIEGFLGPHDSLVILDRIMASDIAS